MRSQGRGNTGRALGQGGLPVVALGVQLLYVWEVWREINQDVGDVSWPLG